MSTDPATPVPREVLLRDLPDPLPISAREVRAALGEDVPRLVVLDDDPTGTQSVADLPVLTAWEVEDLVWALGTGAPAVYVMTNSRSLDPGTAAARNQEVARNALAAASRLGIPVSFVSRSDSTLRGHYPLEPDVLSEVLADAGTPVDGVIIVPAFGEAGRITIGSVHYAGSTQDGYVPVGATEFARDATFGYASSDLRDWVEEKSGGRTPATDVVAVPLELLRDAGTDGGPGAEDSPLVRTLSQLSHGRTAVVDIVEESDLRALALGLLRAGRAGKSFLYRVGPPFVRALVGQDVAAPLTSADVSAIAADGRTRSHGLVVVGSHVSLTTRQLHALSARLPLTEVEIDVPAVLGGQRDEHLRYVVEQALGALASRTVVVRTSRSLVTGRDADESLHVARTVSDAVVEVVRQILGAVTPRFVVAKGGITSSDVASHGLEIRRAVVRGPMLPGIVSLWEPADGPARGIPYVVFAGNVGDPESLADVVEKLGSSPQTPHEGAHG